MSYLRLRALRWSDDWACCAGGPPWEDGTAGTASSACAPLLELHPPPRSLAARFLDVRMSPVSRCRAVLVDHLPAPFAWTGRDRRRSDSTRSRLRRGSCQKIDTRELPYALARHSRPAPRGELTDARCVRGLGKPQAQPASGSGHVSGPICPSADPPSQPSTRVDVHLVVRVRTGVVMGGRRAWRKTRNALLSAVRRRHLSACRSRCCPVQSSTRPFVDLV